MARAPAAARPGAAIAAAPPAGEAALARPSRQARRVGEHLDHSRRRSLGRRPALGEAPRRRGSAQPRALAPWCPPVAACEGTRIAGRPVAAISASVVARRARHHQLRRRRTSPSRRTARSYRGRRQAGYAAHASRVFDPALTALVEDGETGDRAAAPPPSARSRSSAAALAAAEHEAGAGAASARRAAAPRRRRRGPARRSSSPAAPSSRGGGVEGEKTLRAIRRARRLCPPGSALGSSNTPAAERPAAASTAGRGVAAGAEQGSAPNGAQGSRGGTRTARHASAAARDRGAPSRAWARAAGRARRALARRRARPRARRRAEKSHAPVPGRRCDLVGDGERREDVAPGAAAGEQA